LQAARARARASPRSAVRSLGTPVMTTIVRTARRASLLAAASLAALGCFLAPSSALACACGCGVFDVGEGTLAPTDSPSGFTAWFRYSYMDQDQNWESDHRAPASD